MSEMWPTKANMSEIGPAKVKLKAIDLAELVDLIELRKYQIMPRA